MTFFAAFINTYSKDIAAVVYFHKGIADADCIHNHFLLGNSPAFDICSFVAQIVH